MSIPTYPHRSIEIKSHADMEIVWARSIINGRRANAFVRLAPGFLENTGSDGREMVERELDAALLRLASNDKYG